MTSNDRSLAPITTEDLRRPALIAQQDREEFFTRYPKNRVLAHRVIAAVLCQGAALHFLEGHNGVGDFDVWTFYAAHPTVRYPARRCVARDFGDPTFGRSLDYPEFIGRHVDLLGRSLRVDFGADPVHSLRAYLFESRTSSAHHLAQKAVVLLEPTSLLGTVVWPAE